MNTQTHLLISALLFTKPGKTGRNIAVLIGAVVPDAFLFYFWIWGKTQGIQQNVLWGKLYWQDPWQTFSAISNSIFLYGLLVAMGCYVVSTHGKVTGNTNSKNVWFRFSGDFVMFLGMSALIHLAFDFPFHAGDAHQHFWPFFEWRFYSPLSYWEKGHFGGFVQIAEMLLAICAIVVLFRRFASLHIRFWLCVAGTLYVGVPVYWVISTVG